MSAVATRPQRPTAASAPPPDRTKRRRWTSYVLPAFTIAMIVYLASPVFLMILYSFNDIRGERQIARFTCCTLNWWRGWRQIPDLNEALWTSLRVAVPASLRAGRRWRRRGRRTLGRGRHGAHPAAAAASASSSVPRIRA